MNLRQGRLAAVRPAGLKDLVVYANGLLPTPPPIVAVPGAPYPIDGNANYGCCTIDGVAHLREAWAAKYGLKLPAITEAEVTSTYFGMTPGGQDTGLNELDVLKAWQTAGLLGGKIEGYIPVSVGDLVAQHQSVAFFDGCYLGIKCPRSAQMQFARNEPWTFQGEETEDGHCVVALGYDKNGDLECATWGGIATLTAGFRAHYLEEAWCLLSEELVAQKKDSLGIDLASLRKDLQTI